jgi:hypothetical protein
VCVGGSRAALDEVKRGDSPLALVLGVVPHRMGRAAARQALNIATNKQAFERVGAAVFPVTKDNHAGYAGWEEEPPGEMEIPWETDLKLEPKRE